MIVAFFKFMEFCLFCYDVLRAIDAAVYDLIMKSFKLCLECQEDNIIG